MKKNVAEELLNSTRNLMDALDQIISTCQNEMKMDDPNRVRILKKIGLVNSDIYDEIMHPIALEHPDIAKKYFPNAPFSIDP